MQVLGAIPGVHSVLVVRKASSPIEMTLAPGLALRREADGAAHNASHKSNPIHLRPSVNMH